MMKLLYIVHVIPSATLIQYGRVSVIIVQTMVSFAFSKALILVLQTT